MVVDIEPMVDLKTPSNEEIKAAISEISPEVLTKPFRFECEISPEGILLVKVFLGTQPENVDPPPQLTQAIKRAAKHLGFIDVEIIYRNPNITNYEEPEPLKYPRKTITVRDQSDGSTREHTY